MTFNTVLARQSAERTKIKLNLGCGEFLLNPPYINVDRRKPDAYDPKVHQLKKVDLSRGQLPWADGEVDYIVLHHALEHLTYDQGQLLVEECYRILRKGGVITIVTPDFDYLVQEYRRNVATLKGLAELMLFCEGPEGDRHRSAWTHVLLKRLAWESGFKVDEETPVSEFPNLVANVIWQCGIRCIKEK